jgi:hypothetical protein
MADFYIALQDFKSAAHALAVTDKIIKEKLRSVESTFKLTTSQEEKLTEIEVNDMNCIEIYIYIKLSHHYFSPF